ncbi:M23 family metallopeptidase [Streptomyces rhizosphaericola]|uniref:M23 family metallopeptidase n=1 Tax=Streptomyces rhizosphaericola TaxID=2564098 RepID=A0ABY2PA67_9ACTN|nr:M23 family metallopeptidase [Streptomyces rhizosphaericola]TGZ05017.1 M23 family metallopeptidase [Streptomyces rhizosphaericola]
MNDQHPHAGPVGYDTRSTGSFDTDPLFGTPYSGSDTTDYAASGYDTSYGASYGAHNGHGDHNGHTGSYDSSAWDTGAQQTVTYDPYAAPAQAAQTQTAQAQTAEAQSAWQQQTADTGAYDTTGFTTAAYGTAPYGTGTYESDEYDTGAYATATYGTGTAYVTDGSYGTGTQETGAYGVGAYGVGAYDTGTYDTGTYDTTAFTTGGYDVGAYDTGAYDTGAYGTAAYDTGAYDATAWNSGATPEDAAYEPEQMSHQLYEQQQRESEEGGTSEIPVLDLTPGTDPDERPEPDTAPAPAASSYDDGGESPAPLSADRTVVHAPRSRARRRSPAKRSALLTVAVPSACVMSVAGIAAASVSGISDEEKPEKTTSLAVADPSTVKAVAANNKLDSQLEQLSEGSDDFRQRASRTQERIDLKQRQAEEKKKREEEAARREALRPKFVLPVKQHGLSAYYGQAGVNWMSVHTGIDFPVGYGSPVMAATDGTVRTQYNSAYGNMAIVTMADGTETWYCHLSSTKIRSGPVKAGDVIAYAGSSGNSTGPHLHFEVRPGGGASVDPLAWLRSHGVEPT